MRYTLPEAANAVIAFTVVTAAIVSALWAADQPSSDPGRQALLFLAVPAAAALLQLLQQRAFGAALTVYAETLLLPALIAAQLVRLGAAVEFAVLMIALQFAAAVIGWWLRRTQARYPSA
jgi:hypothetical protein